MAYTTINKSSEHFNTKLYTGTGSSNAITGVGFAPDWVWLKRRDTAGNNYVFDTVRGATQRLITNDIASDAVDTASLTAFGSDGFTVNTEPDLNTNSGTFASWNWKANGAGSANTDGSRTTTVSVNTTAGFSVGTCASLATNNDTLGHGLGAVPKMIMVKNTQSTGNWFVYHNKLPTGSVGQGSYLTLNATASYSDGSIWNNTAPTSSVFTVKGGDFATGESLVFYAFAEKQGFSKFSSYIGNGSTDGTFVYTGFKPSFILRKRTDDAGSWLMQDNKRPGSNRAVVDSLPTDNNVLYSNTSDAELYNNELDILSNGFKLRADNSFGNSSGATYIYMAFAEAPLVGSNGVTAKAR